MDELNDMQNTVHEYRKALDAFSKRTNTPTQFVELRGSGEEREKIAKMDADLSAIEERAQLQALQLRLAKLEAQPMFETRAPKAATLGDANDRASEAYAQRWLNAVVRGDSHEMRALSLGSSGAAIPTDLERRIVNKLQQANVIRSMCAVSNIDSKRSIAVENALPTTNLVAEAGAITPADPTYGTQISVVPYKFVTAVKMSQEFIEDAIGNGGIGSGLQYVADKCGLSIGLKTEEYFTTGTGSSEPEGAAGSNMYSKTVNIAQNVNLGTAAALTAITGDSLIDAVHYVAPQYRNSPRFAWLLSDSVLKHVRKIKSLTTGSNEYVWRPTEGGLGLTGGAPGTIYGVPYYIGQYVPTTTVENNVYAVVGDWNYFEIFDRTGITSMMDPYSAAANHQTTLYVYTRTDSRIMLAQAFATIHS